ncbi:VapE domain-containing protein [Aquimarina mytili]|uniref:Virulence-associated protein E-like domain-containing protein n=1 Tax=Aquimarina mytili TaxID=874423 RepID=A0A936ZXW0_9FLAO|nr:VapE domain-containing protein [Aquimarina mytili]MBL0684306.1 hypothetical protein [Aquimarina mytili]
MLLDHKDIRPNHSIEDLSEKPDEKKQKTIITRVQDYLDEHYELRINVLTMELEYREIKQVRFRTLDDRQLNTIWLDLQNKGIKCTDSTLMKILNSNYTKSYHPIQEYFYNLPEYDGKDYIRELADTITIADIEIDDITLKDLWYDYLKKWIVGNASTCLGLGINQTCLILVGGQGSGKTTWLNRLCPKDMQEFLVCSHINPSLTDKNTANFLAEKWFVNIDDQLETIFGKDFNSMKAIITAPFVTNRKLFHKLTKTRPRICSFMGSVNSPRFLTDSENRRYLVFTAAEINYKHNVDMQKVWAQAAHLAKEKFSYWFSHEEMKQLNKVNDIYKQSTPEEEWLLKLYEPCKASDPKAMFMMPSEMLSQMNAHSGIRMSMKRLSQAMDRCKFGQPISKRFKDKGSRKVYPVRLVSDEMENNLQKELREMHKEKPISESRPKPDPELPL